MRRLSGAVSERDLAFVVSAFDVPRVVYDPVSKRLYEDPRPSKFLPTAEVRGGAAEAAAGPVGVRRLCEGRNPQSSRGALWEVTQAGRPGSGC